MEKLKARVNAKINLNLLITGREGNMHTLDSLMHSIGIFDEIEMTVGDSGVYMLGKKDDKNSVNKVIEACKAIGIENIRFDIGKNIPFCAGLGGSSADMAGAVYLVEQKFGVKLDALSLGSDVPFMVDGGFARVQGTGDKLTKLSAVDYFLVVAKGKGGVSTKEAYAEFDKRQIKSENNTLALIEALQGRKLENAAKYLKNDLQSVAFSLNPEVKRTYALMNKFTDLTLMSGSGSAVFGIFEQERTARKCQEFLSTQTEYARLTKTVEKGIEII